MPPSHDTGLVVGKFWPPHRGHQLLLETAAAQVIELLVLVYSNPDDTTFPAPERARWLQELYRTDEKAEGRRIGTTSIRIIALTVADGVPDNAADDYTAREFVRWWLSRQKLKVDVVFTSEAYGPGFSKHLGFPHVMVDQKRERVPVSGTLIRTNTAAYAAHLHPFIAAQLGVVAPSAVPRIVFLGAENSGKTTLCQALAEKLGTVWVPEFGRQLTEQKQGHLEYEDLLYIARRQLELEEAADKEARNYLVCDTDATTTALYSYYYFHRCDPALRRLAAVCRQRYAHAFVCLPTVPFEDDGWRSPKALRQFQHGAILMQLEMLDIPYTVIGGTVEERVAAVRRIISV
jgi:NadR type nicotinamide-nucleotide adenylyltransferase